MAKIIIEVMPKPVLLDPQGKAIKNALEKSGDNPFIDVRVGKRLELTVEGEATAKHLEDAEKVARELFINQELEYIVSVRGEEI